MTDLSHSFGSERVTPEERQRRIRGVFTAVARRYDLMNDLMSLGIHRLWKRRFAAMARPRPGQIILDVAGGTGDIARLLAAPDRRVVICDPSLPMMAEGRRRGLPHVGCVGTAAEALPFPDGSVDTVTIAFGIRNTTRIETALAEMTRVLKPGGRLLCLEFSRPAAPIRPFYQAFSNLVIPRLGAWVARAPDAYAYLVESIRRFPDQEAMKRLFEQAGLEDVTYTNLSFGIACVHVGRKPDAC